MKIMIFLIIVFVMASLLVIESNHLNVSNNQDMQNFKNIYGNWINKIYQNTISVTGDAIKLNWMPENNGTNLSNSKP